MSVLALPAVLALLALPQERSDTLAVPLRQAAESGDSVRVARLLADGADVDARTGYGQSPLMFAVGAGHVPTVRLLLAGGADPDLADRDGDVALGYYAASAPGEHAVLVEELLAAGASPEGAGGEVWTPLTYLAGVGDTAAVRSLLAAGADVNAQASDGATPLLIGIDGGFAEVVRILLEAGADAGAAWPEGATALIAALGMGMGELVPMLLEHGADPSVPASNGFNVRMAAAEAGDLALFRRFEAMGIASPDSTDEGYTLLMAAAFGGDTAIVREVLGAGGDLHARTTDGRTALIVAASAGHGGAASMLLEAGADPRAATEDGFTAVFSAAVQADTGLFALLAARGAALTDTAGRGVTVLMAAAEGGDSTIVARVLAEGADIHARDDDGRTALMGYAWRTDAPAVCRALLGAGANPDARGPGGVTALMIAAERGHVESLAVLLGGGAAIDTVMDSGETALMLAAQAGQTQVVEALIAAGANPAVANQDGATALTVAAARGHGEVVEALIAAGAPLDHETIGGLTAADLAVDAGEDAIADRLVAAGARAPVAGGPVPDPVNDRVARAQLWAVLPAPDDLPGADVTHDGPAQVEGATEAWSRNFGAAGQSALGGSRIMSLETIAARFGSPQFARASVRGLVRMGPGRFVERLLERLPDRDAVDTAWADMESIPSGVGDTAVGVTATFRMSFAQLEVPFVFFSRGSVRIVLTAVAPTGAVSVLDLLPVARRIDTLLMEGTVGTAEPVFVRREAPPPPVSDRASRTLMRLLPAPDEFLAEPVTYVDETVSDEGRPGAARDFGGSGVTFRYRDSELVSLRVEVEQYEVAASAADAVTEAREELMGGASARETLAGEMGIPPGAVRIVRPAEGPADVAGARLEVRTAALTLDLHMQVFAEGPVLVTILAAGPGEGVQADDVRALTAFMRDRILATLIE